MVCDQKIPGAGTHHCIVDKNRTSYNYPFNSEFENTIRPLRYALNELFMAYDQINPPRHSIANSGIHLEGCMKRCLGYRFTKKPLGCLVKPIEDKGLLGNCDINDVKQVIEVVNKAKHKYTNDGPGPTFRLEDALYTYFLTRYFGSVILTIRNEINPLVNAVNVYDEYFRGSLLIKR